MTAATGAPMYPQRPQFPTDALCSIVALGLLACTEAATGPADRQAPPPIPATATITTPQLGLIVGDTRQLSAQAFDSALRPLAAAFEWSSADSTIASVGRTDGVVTAKAEGSTTVTAVTGQLSAVATVMVADVKGTIAFTRLSYTTRGQLDFDVMSYTNRVVTPIPRPGAFTSIAAPAWSPDGSQLVVEVIRDVIYNSATYHLRYRSDLHVLAAVGPAATARALTTDGFSRAPAWSPDGSRIAYVGGPMMTDSMHIYVVSAGGGTPTQLTTKRGAYSTPRWSPDGSRLAFTDGSIEPGGTIKPGDIFGDIFVVNADGSGLTNVTQSLTYDGEPSWSPDGTQLAFVRSRGDDQAHLFIVDVATRNVRPLTSSGDWNVTPVWSPDGRYIAFAHSAPGQASAIFVLRLDAPVPVRITTPERGFWDEAPVWKR